MTTAIVMETKAVGQVSERTEFQAARLVAAVCATREAEQVKTTLHRLLPEPERAELLWLTWVQWRALGREAMVRETGLSLWTVTCRLRQLREAGIVIPSWARETDLLARGQFHAAWEAATH